MKCVPEPATKASIICLAMASLTKAEACDQAKVMLPRCTLGFVVEAMAFNIQERIRQSMFPFPCESVRDDIRLVLKVM